jgi:hypothetical protein
MFKSRWKQTQSLAMHLREIERANEWKAKAAALGG